MKKVRLLSWIGCLFGSNKKTENNTIEVKPETEKIIDNVILPVDAYKQDHKQQFEAIDNVANKIEETKAPVEPVAPAPVVPAPVAPVAKPAAPAAKPVTPAAKPVAPASSRPLPSARPAVPAPVARPATRPATGSTPTTSGSTKSL